MASWINARIDGFQDEKRWVTFEFATEADAKEFFRLATISKDVDDELLLFGDGAIRTVSRQRKKK